MKLSWSYKLTFTGLQVLRAWFFPLRVDPLLSGYELKRSESKNLLQIGFESQEKESSGDDISRSLWKLYEKLTEESMKTAVNPKCLKDVYNQRNHTLRKNEAARC